MNVRVPWLFIACVAGACVAGAFSSASPSLAADVAATGLSAPFGSTRDPVQGARVRVVGHGLAFTTIQAAIDASADGDVVLVEPGSHAGFVIDGKGVSVVKEAGPLANVFGATVRNLPAASVVVLSGLTIQASGAASLRATNNAGLLRVDACRSTGTFGGGSFSSCAAVAIHGSTFIGGAGSGASSPPTPAIAATDSALALHGSFARGWSGRWVLVGETWIELPPRAGVSLNGGTLHVAGSETRGGEGASGFDGSCTGGAPPTEGGPGAPAIELLSGASATVLDALVVGGPGGIGGCGEDCETCVAENGAPGPPYSDPAAVTALAGVARELDVVAATRERATLSFSVEGAPGDRAYLAFSPGAAQVPTSAQHGVRYFELPARKLYLGTVNAFGSLDAAITVGSLGPGAEAVRWFAELVIVDAAGTIRLGSPANLTLLDGEL